jgi:hypothetical protein
MGFNIPIGGGTQQAKLLEGDVARNKLAHGVTLMEINNEDLEALDFDSLMNTSACWMLFHKYFQTSS